MDIIFLIKTIYDENSYGVYSMIYCCSDNNICKYNVYFCKSIL